MQKINLYFFRKILTYSLLIIAAITALLFILQSMKFLELILNKGFNIKDLLFITFLSMPSLWNDTAPIAMFIGILICWQIMQNNNEMIIIQTSGLTSWQISKPVIYLGFIVAFLCLLFSAFIINKSYLSYLHVQNKIKTSVNIKIIEPNKFTQLTKNLIIYVKENHKNKLKGVLIYNLKAPEETAIYAEEANIINSRKNIPMQILLKKGTVQKSNLTNSEVTFANFEVYVLSLNSSEDKKLVRYGARELYLWELFLPRHFVPYVNDLYKTDIKKYKSLKASYAKEISKRLSNPLLAILFAVAISYFFSRATFSRFTNYIPALKSSIFAISFKIIAITVSIVISNLTGIFVFFGLIILLIIYLALKIKFKSS